MQLAQINSTKIKDSLDSTIMTVFVYNLDLIDALAGKSKGFVWRLKDENDNVISIKISEDDYLLVNGLVWDIENGDDPDGLYNFKKN